jgi:hypothetical protein
VMRRRAFPFTAPARVTPESVIGVVVAHGEPVSVDAATLDLSTRVIISHLRVLGMELVPVEKASRPWWRRKTNQGGSK